MIRADEHAATGRYIFTLFCFTIAAVSLLLAIIMAIDPRPLLRPSLIAAVSPAALALYFLPSIIAFRKFHPNLPALFALNLVLGGTIIGWGIALVWALIRPSQKGS